MVSAKSFRDPAGFCFDTGRRVFRFVRQDNLFEFQAFLSSRSASNFLKENELISTRRLEQKEGEEALEKAGIREETESLGAVFEHERVSFPSFPYEWAPEMLYDAGDLTLRLAHSALQDGFGLKDATPYNILFQGSRAVFVDLLSFEKREPGDVLWKPYAQFVRTFLLPLLANQRWGVNLKDIFLAHRDGLKPQEIYQMTAWPQKLLPPYLNLISLPVWLSPKAEASSIYAGKNLDNPEKAQFILEAFLRRVRRSLSACKPVQKASTWSTYMDSNSYSKENFAVKEEFVARFLNEFKPKRVLDVGANTGHFSALAAQAGAGVVAIDSDPACVNQIWSRARGAKLDILPLVLDLARPSPPVGWRNQECSSFLQRATGHFDAVFMLAVLHHLMVTERAPLEEILDLSATLTRTWLIIEYVGPEDEMFRKIARGRENLFTGFDPVTFEKACTRRFDLVRWVKLPNVHRCLYLLRKKEVYRRVNEQ